MGDADYYRAQAKRCIRLAAAAPNPKAARRWDDLAADYERISDVLEGKLTDYAGMPPSQMQRQLMQQQQQKKKDQKT